METKEVNILYHYTSLEALYAIIDGIYYKHVEDSDAPTVLFKLRATHASFLNDVSEGSILPNALKELGANEELLFQLTIGYPFVVSFSELGDDLNMWRCYANNGKGISVCLDKSEIEKAVKEYNNSRLDKCKYVTQTKLINILRHRGIRKMLNSENLKPLLQLLAEAYRYKDKSFHAEKEWRIHDLNVEDGFRINSNNNLIIPYHEIEIPVSAVHSIILGPKCDYERNKFSIYRMLKTKISSTDLTRIQIMKSKVPLI